ncbi:MAG: response regulator transcription factor [Chloroflexi bacterium]|nr:response regulator transcription factor [Chloroflexota bacterium]
MRILIVDDHSLFRDGIAGLLIAGGQDVVGQAQDGNEAVAMAMQLSPDLILLDLNMPRLSGFDALRQIKQNSPDMLVVMLTSSEENEHIVNAIRLGADGYLLKHLNSREFMDMINRLQHGEPAISGETTMKLLKNSGNSTELKPESLISNRELEVLRFVAIGKTNREIAEQLSISENTIKFHIKNIMQKLSVSNRTEAAMYISQRGLL